MGKKLLSVILLALLVCLLGSCSSDFDIKGAWKVVGGEGWGQAQQDSIINFDGKNVNLYSPNDTYSFYKDDNGQYHLDVTGLLGGNKSFNVNIVDDNTLELYDDEILRVKLQREGSVSDSDMQDSEKADTELVDDDSSKLALFSGDVDFKDTTGYSYHLEYSIRPSFSVSSDADTTIGIENLVVDVSSEENYVSITNTTEGKNSPPVGVYIVPIWKAPQNADISKIYSIYKKPVAIKDASGFLYYEEEKGERYPHLNSYLTTLDGFNENCFVDGKHCAIDFSIYPDAEKFISNEKYTFKFGDTKGLEPFTGQIPEGTLPKILEDHIGWVIMISDIELDGETICYGYSDRSFGGDDYYIIDPLKFDQWDSTR